MRLTPTVRARLATRPTCIAVLLVLVLALVPVTACAPRNDWVEMTPADAPVSNPLKGLVPYAPDDPASDPAWPEDAPPVTMEWVSLPVSDVVTGPETYDWTVVEERLDAVASRGHQVVLRFYLDFPGRPSALPGYLLDQGVITRTYTVHGNGAADDTVDAGGAGTDDTGVSVSPDYDDPRVMRMLTGFVAAFGAVYDGDPRLAFITQGLVGFWGEGHTWPFDGQVSADNPRGEDWMPSPSHQEALLEAWDEAFDITPTQVRYPTAQTIAHDVGYHDDSFAYTTLPDADWHFWSLMSEQGPAATEAWRSRPMGGEIYPPLQACVFAEPGRCAQDVGLAGQDVTEAVELTHATWLLAEEVFDPGLEGRARERALALSARLGYTLTVRRWRYDRRSSTLSVEVSNTGVAPFAYDWQIEVVTVSDDGHVLTRTGLDGDLRSLLPGDTQTWSGQVRVPDGATVLLRVVNPLPGGVGLSFANAGQDTVLAGYLTLGAAPG